MPSDRYLIDELCELSGFSRRTVHYYVQEGLVDPPAGRGRGGYYGPRQLAQLARIRELQDQGYRLDAIRGLVGAPAQRPAASELASVPARAWIRYEAGTGVEVHVTEEALSRLGPRVAEALAAVRAIVDENEGGENG